MEDKYIKIPAEYYNLFPVSIDNMRVEFIEDINGDKYVPERCLNWNDFLNKFNKDLKRKEELMPLYDYVSTSKAIGIELKKEDIDGIY